MIFPGNSTSDYAIKANAIGSSLSAFTVCFFVKLKAVSGSNGSRSVYSYAVEGSGSPYGNDIYVDLFPTITINIGTCQKMPRTPDLRLKMISGITSVLRGRTPKVIGSCIWMDNSERMEQA
ncbi:hypothetical protein OS493_027607 [Desmophyllum pertusum]|uniref:Uncharacterized protein n=1 Tax=Desmophyllum pertusum TaxID=174260 RepID=A0A9W9ZKK7_9CNID|nr:hypothetical protein OS493_027607 [Desmophyllum pertusum]